MEGNTTAELASAFNEDELASTAGVVNYVNAAVPFFFLFIFIELCVSLLRGHSNLYRWNEVMASLSMGIVQQLSGIWLRALTIAPYAYLFRHYRFYTFDKATLEVHVLTLFMVDLAYYWFHRYAHEFHIAWAGHSVHHSGEDYNLATALRQGAMQPLFSWAFYLPLALMGIPPAMFLTHSQWNTLGQFWFHTSEIGRMGILEYLLNTPAHHRVHHRPPGNCNYGGIFIIYDKLFGTFVPEDEQMDLYGLAKQLNTFDPVEANVSHLRRMSNIHSSGVRGDEDSSVLGAVGRWVNLLLSRRVRHAFVLHPQALLEEQPSSAFSGRGGDKAPSAPAAMHRTSNRTKWNGALAGEADEPDEAFSRFIFLSYLTLHFVAAVAVSYVLMLCAGEVELSFGLAGQSALDLLSVDGLRLYVLNHKRQIFVSALFLVCMHSLKNIGRMSDNGAKGVNSLSGEPGRLCVLVAFAHLLVLRGTISLSSCISICSVLVIPWFLVFHLTNGEIPRTAAAKIE